MERRIRKELFNLGIFSNMKGYRYIIEAVKQFSCSVTMKEILERIAESNGKSKNNVESAIRSAIKTGKHELPAWENYDCQTVKDFIATMYYRTKESANE